MTDLFELFDDESSDEPEAAKPMTASQRGTLREMFASLGVTTARSQFDLIEEVSGERVQSVGEVTEALARTLIPQLRHRVSTARQSNTGDAWADREEDTWIDRL